MAGALHRVIRIATKYFSGGSGIARAVVEDDYHHFRVQIDHDGTRVTRTQSESIRYPYSLCPSAGERLNLLVGMNLSPDMRAAFRHAEALLQCTHQFDIAAVAITAAARGTSSRRYDLVVPDLSQSDSSARLTRDGEQLLSWKIKGGYIVGPEPFTGQSWGAGFSSWVVNHFPPDLAEAVLVLRQVVFIADGKLTPGNFTEHPLPKGGCWIQQPERHLSASRVRDSVRDFTGKVELLTADDNEWLAFSTKNKVESD